MIDRIDKTERRPIRQADRLDKQIDRQTARCGLRNKYIRLFRWGKFCPLRTVLQDMLAGQFDQVCGCILCGLCRTVNSHILLRHSLIKAYKHKIHRCDLSLEGF